MPNGANQLRLIGTKLRMLRRERGLKLREVSAATGLSPGFISQLENDRVGASFASLFRLAHFYQINLSDLFRSIDVQERPILSRPGQRMSVLQTDQFRDEWLVSEPDCAMQVDIVTVKPDGSSGEPYTHGGEEFAYVLAGTAVISVGGKEYELAPGDLLYFKSTVPHAWRNAGNEEVRILFCTTPPTV